MTTAREIMTEGAHRVGDGETVLDAAREMARLGVGTLPVCGTDDGLKGVLSDHDIVTKVLAEDRDPARERAADFARDEVVTLRPDDSTEEILRTMTAHGLARLPVVDGHRLVGMVARDDVARTLSDPKVGDRLEALTRH